MKKTTLLAAVASLVVASAARADVVEVSSTTLLTVGPQTRGGAPGVAPELVTAAPAYEMLNVSARGVTNPFAKDLQLVLSTWGSIEIADHRWDAGTTGAVNADIQAAYVSGRLLSDRLMLRLGRTMIAAGAGRMLHLDGGEAVVTLGGFRLSGYVGAPVSQRFQSRGQEVSWNPMAGDLAYGGRAGYYLALPGFSGRGAELGASYNQVTKGGDTVREELAGDARVALWRPVTLLGFVGYAPTEKRFSEITAALKWQASRKLYVTTDYRFTAPDLFLSRLSIFSVFSDSERHLYGAGLVYELPKGFEVAGNWHFSSEPGKEEGKKYVGGEGDAELSWRRGNTAGGVEGFYLDALENGYWGGRLWGRREFGPRLFTSVDVIAHQFREAVNGQPRAITGTLSAGVKLAYGFSAVVSGRAGMTPYLEQAFDVMAKLVYNQTYTAREVR